ncbi:MAG: ankyrin repeat domain-containing protein [Gemmatimonadaceae bacterium]|nr:ankyrin repeat domain-containing protein [Gemmatimonadaceae bacterium]
MSPAKIVAVLNWVAVGIICLVAGAEALSPAKGGDAATRGFGQAFFVLAFIAVVVLVGLNVLPFNWTKYVALGLVALPILFFQIWPVWQEKQRIARNEARYKMEDAQPIFEDQQRDQIARAIRGGDLDKLKVLLQSPVERLNERGALLANAISEASYAGYRDEEKLEGVRLLLAAGAKFDSTKALDVPPHFSAAQGGRVELLRLLLEQGADANAYQVHLEYSILFEAVAATGTPEAAVRALLEFGADPNATAVFDKAVGPMTPLWRAARLNRWGVCAALLEHGADPNFKLAGGPSFRDYVQEAEKGLSQSDVERRADFDRMKKVLDRVKR